MKNIYINTFITIIILNLLIFTKTTLAEPLVENSIIGLYTAYYNRSPDKEGYDYWIQQAEETENLSSLLNISRGFSEHSKFKKDYPSSDTNVQFITKIYQNILNRLPDEGGLDYWVSLLNGGLSRPEFVVNYVNNILNYEGVDPTGVSSKNMFTNKVIMGKCFIDALGIDSNGNTDSLAYTRSIDILSGITEKTDSFNSAIDKIKSYLPDNIELPETCPSTKENTIKPDDSVTGTKDSVCIDIPVSPINIPVGSIMKYKISNINIDPSIYEYSPTSMTVEMIEVNSSSYKEKYTYTYPNNKLYTQYVTATYSTDNSYMYINKMEFTAISNDFNYQVYDTKTLYSPPIKDHEINSVCLNQTWESTYIATESSYNREGENIQQNVVNFSQNSFVESIDTTKKVNSRTYKTYKLKQQIISGEITTWVDALNGLYVYSEFHDNTGKLLTITELTSYTVGKPNVSSEPTTDNNTAPIANNDTSSTSENTVLTLRTLLNNDTDTENDVLSISAVDPYGSEGGTIIDNRDGTVTYTPTIGFSGTENFNYTISDGIDTATARVTITVNRSITIPKFSCLGKKTCGSMSSCAEAVFYLNQCGVTRLDRDNDGIPCESICK